MNLRLDNDEQRLVPNSCAYCSTLLAGRKNVRTCHYQGCEAKLCCANCQREHHDEHLPDTETHDFPRFEACGRDVAILWEPAAVCVRPKGHAGAHSHLSPRP